MLKMREKGETKIYKTKQRPCNINAMWGMENPLAVDDLPTPALIDIDLHW